MKINEIINEVEIKPYEKEVIDVDTTANGAAKVLQMLRQFCPATDDLLKSPIWRGAKNHTEDVLKINPSTGIRQSQNTENYYTELMDHSPYFKGWPKRSRSLICSLDFDRACSYSSGNTYAVFPGRGVKVAVCPGFDIWDTEANIPLFGGYIKFPDINYSLEELGFALDYRNMLTQVKSLDFKLRLKFFCESNNIENIPNPEEVLPQILAGMRPEVTGFHLMGLEEIAVSGIVNKEVWIGSPCILVSQDVIQTINEYKLQAFNDR